MDQWTEIPQSQIALVKNERLEDACVLLRTRPIVSLPEGDQLEWTDDLKETSPTLQAFLVRGVAFENPPLWFRAFLNEESGELWVQQGDWIIPPRFRYTKVESPVVVLLQNTPDSISITAHQGESVIASDPLRPDSKSTAFWLVECDYPLKH